MNSGITTKHVLKHIAPLQLGKVFGLLYGVLGLLFVPFFLIMATVTPQLPPGQRGVFAIMGLGFAVAAPLIYGVMGFLFGVIGGALYNLVAKWVGGIEVEVE
jgi:hypothetical protein